jgi:hypothetical protein
VGAPPYAYRATLLGYAPDGVDANGNVVHLVRWRTALDGVERSARTRGFVTEMFHGLGTGARVNIIRDGRGSIIAIEKVGA